MISSEQDVLVMTADGDIDSNGPYSDETSARAREIGGYLIVLNSEPARILEDYRPKPAAMVRLGSAVKLNDAQKTALAALCARYGAEFVESDFQATFDLPSGYVAGWAGPLYVGCSPEGEISS